MDPQILEVGELVTLKGRFATAAGVATDPTNVTLTITAPNGTVTTIGPVATPYVGLTHVSAGVFTSDLTLNAAGAWRYRWSGTGAVVVGETGIIYAHPVGQGGVRSGPCTNWVSVDDLNACEGVPATATEGQIERAISVASDLLWRWSGYRWGGLCFDTVRPCAQNSYLEDTYGWDYQGNANWWWNSSWGSCSCQASSHRACGCNMLSEIQLGRVPVVGIVEVRIDGAVLSPTKYRNPPDDYQWLVRTDGGVWPCCQDLTKSDAVGAANTNTFGVDFIWGQNPPAAGVEAAIDLAVQTVKACVGADCEIPEEFAQIVRQGETRINIQPTDLGRDQNGNIREGLRSVDRFLSSLGSQTHRPAVVASPDRDALVRRTG